MTLPGVETLQPAAQPDAGVTGHDPRPAAGRGRDDVAALIGDQAGGRVPERPP